MDICYVNHVKSGLRCCTFFEHPGGLSTGMRCVADPRQRWMAVGKTDLGVFYILHYQRLFLEPELVCFEMFALGFWFLGYQQLQKHTEIVYKQKSVLQTIKEG